MLGIRSMGAAAISAAALAAAAGTSHGAWAPPYYQLHRAGLTDAEHTAPDGTQYSDVLAVNAFGRVAGNSNRLANGYNTDFGRPEGDGSTAWTWTVASGTVRLGLSDAEHISTSGTRQSFVAGLTDAGLVTGNSTRYQGETTAGQSAWAWTANTGHTRLGFFDAAHTLVDGSQSSSVRMNNEAGQVIGHSSLMAGGSSAWSWTHAGGSVQLGLTDAEHTGSGSEKTSNAETLNQAGRVIGRSQRFGASSGDSGSSAWTWSAGSGTVRLGLTDADHTSAEGRRNSIGTGLNESGRVIGYSERFVGATDPFTPGRSAWTWTEVGGQVQIGLIGAEHTQSNGFRSSTPAAVSATGWIAGQSQRFNGFADAGRSAWAWSSGGGTVEIGLSDAEHTRNDGFRVSEPIWINGTDRVAGTASRFSGGDDTGVSAWTWSPSGGTVRVGLTDAGHTITGFQVNVPMAVSDSGHVAGTAMRASNGQSVWVWSPVTGNTIRTGLTNTQHTRTTGSVQRSVFLAMNDSGDVLGTADRYAGNSARGQSGWFFDADSGQTHALVFSTNTVGTAFTTPAILTDSGIVLGSYRLYTGLSAFTERGFVWSLENQFADLGTLIDGQLSSFGWELLSQVADSAEVAAIAGSGRALGGTSVGAAVYVLTIPAPGMALPLFGMLMATARLRRR